MGGMGRRIARLEEQTAGAEPARHWPREDMREKVLDELDFALATDSPVALCREELALLGAGDPSELPERLRRLVWLQPPTHWQIAKRYEGPPQRPFEGWRDRARRHEERVRDFVEEAKQGDRELLETNRASVGLPPLTPEQITEWGLEGTVWREGDTT